MLLQQAEWLQITIVDKCLQQAVLSLGSKHTVMSAALRVSLTMAGAAVLSLVLPSHATLRYSTGSLH